MTANDRYAIAPEPGTWDVPATGAARFTWQYDDGRDRLLALYAKGKDKQWDAAKRITWDTDVNPFDVLGFPEEMNPLLGTPVWDKMTRTERDEYRLHHASWIFSQFLHGEQGALAVAARIVESVPDLDSKFYAATQVMDEARHVELFSRFIRDKIGMFYPVNNDLARLLSSTLTDSRWDLPYLGMQVLIEGLALAAFGLYRDLSGNPLVKQLLAYVMQDEARHVAFGRLALRDYYTELTEAERAEREEFVVEGCYLMRDRFLWQEVFARLGLPVAECLGYVKNAPTRKLYESLLFSRIVPCVKDIGLWGGTVQRAYADMGVLDAARGDLTTLMRRDEQIAEEYDQELTARQAEVDAAIASAGEG